MTAAGIAMVDISLNYLSLCAVRLEAVFGDLTLAVATGSLWQHEDRHFLVTNWHVVTGRHVDTEEPLHKHGAVPDRLRVVLHHPERVGWWKVANIELYDSQGRPDWYEHPVHRHRVDVAAVPLQPTDEVRYYPVNLADEFEEFRLEVGQDVFVIGFPKGLTGHHYFPLWKRGTFASEPSIDLEGLPRMLIDSATREGLSGAPVIAQFTGYHRANPDTMSADDWFGSARRLAGVYSSRVPADALDAQLGYVWKTAAVEEILAAKYRPE